MCLYTAETYLAMFAMPYTGPSNPSPWIEKDDEEGLTDDSEIVVIGDMIDPGVKVHGPCAEA